MGLGKAVLLPEEKRKKKLTFQKREAAALTTHSKEAKEETNTCSLQVAFKVPDCGVYTWYRALLQSWCFLSALRDGRFLLHTSCSELLGGTEDIDRNESQLLGDGSGWELWYSALRQGLLDVMHLSHLFFTGWVINQLVAWETQFGWFCFNLE